MPRFDEKALPAGANSQGVVYEYQFPGWQPDAEAHAALDTRTWGPFCQHTVNIFYPITLSGKNEGIQVYFGINMVFLATFFFTYGYIFNKFRSMSVLPRLV